MFPQESKLGVRVKRFPRFLGPRTRALGKWLWSPSSCYHCRCLLAVLPLIDGNSWGDAHRIASAASAPRRMNGCALWLPGAGRVPGERLSALRQPRCPQSPRRPPEGALASPVAGSRCPRLFSGRAGTVFFGPLNALLAAFYMKFSLQKQVHVVDVGPQVSSNNLAPRSWGSRPRTSVWPGGAVPWPV